MLAISCGAVVTLWDHQKSIDSSIHSDSTPDQDGTAVLSFQQSSPNEVTDLSWNHDGTAIATCSSAVETANVALNQLNSTNNSVTVLDELCSPSNTHPTSISNSISFGRKSRYICVSNTVGEISIYDTKKKSQVRCFKLPSPNENHSRNPCGKSCIDPTGKVAAATSASDLDGASYLFDLERGSKTLPRKILVDSAPRCASRALCFSQHIPSHVAVGRNDGSVLIWDVHHNHHSPSCSINAFMPEVNNQLNSAHNVNDITYSPVNSKLLASCSSKISFHDASSGKLIVSLLPPNLYKSSTSFNSISLDTDGFTCAAGTTDASALLYDLRKATSNEPISEISLASQQTDVPRLATRVRFQPMRAHHSSKRISATKIKSRKNQITERRNELHGKETDTKAGPVQELKSNGTVGKPPVFPEEITKTIREPSCDEVSSISLPRCGEIDASIAGDENESSNSIHKEREGHKEQTSYVLPSLDGMSHHGNNHSSGHFDESRHEDSLLASDFVNGRCIYNVEDTIIPSQTKPSESLASMVICNDGNDIMQNATAKSSDETRHHHFPLTSNSKINISLEHKSTQTLEKAKPRTSNHLINVHNEVKQIRHEFNQSIQLLRIELMRKFECQSNEISSLCERNAELMVRLMDENVKLKEENERLRRF